MSNNPNRSTTRGKEPPGPQATYNLAALRLAQSSNSNQNSKVHTTSGGGGSTSKAVSPFGPAGLSNKQAVTLSYAEVAGGSSAARGGTTSNITPNTTSTAALLAALHIGGDDHTSANVNTKAKTSSPPAPTAKYTASASLAQPPSPAGAPAAPATACAAIPPVPRSSSSTNATVAAPPTAVAPPPPGPPYPGPASFSTASRLPAKTFPFAPAPTGRDESLSLPGGQNSDPSRRPMAMMMPPMGGGAVPSPTSHPQQPLPPQQSQQLPAGAFPFPQSAPQIPQPRGADAAFMKWTFANQSQPQQQPQHQSSLTLSATRSNISGPPTPSQSARPFLSQQQLQQQQQQQQQQQPPVPQQQQAYQVKPQPTPDQTLAQRVQQESYTIPGLAPSDRRPLPPQQSSPPSSSTHVPMYTALPPGVAPPQLPPSATPAVQPPSQMYTQGRPTGPQMQQPAMGQPPFFVPQSQPQQQPQQALPFKLPQPLSRGGVPGRPAVPQPTAPTAAAAPSRPTPLAQNNIPTPANLYSTAPQQETSLPSLQPPSSAQPTNFNHDSPLPPTAETTSTSPTVAAAAGTSVALQNLDIQHVLQRMGISAHVAATPPTTAAAAAGGSAAFPSSALNPNTAVAEQLSQLAQRQEQQQVSLNFYSTAAGAPVSQRPPQQQRSQPQQQQQQFRQQRYGQHNGRGGNRQHYDPFQQQQQRGRGRTGAPSGYRHSTRAAPALPVSQFTAPDPEMLKRFMTEYAQQEDADSVSDELRAQQATKLGTVGTLDEAVCLSLIESHDVTFMVTDTGTGKSTRIPMALHKAHPDALIVNAQPRRTAAINLAQRVAELLNAKLGEEVGYSVRGEHIGDLGDTKVMYVTTYSLFIYFLWHDIKEELPFTYIIVDEFHERTPDVEVILLMLKLWLKKHPKAFKLILCSATAQVEEWHDFFDGLNVGTYSRSPIMYPVREYFIEDLQKLVGFRAAPIEPQDSNNMVTSEQMHQLILVCKQLLEYLAKNTATQDSVLVFMPGRTQVELMTTWMRDNLEESVEPVAWYRDVELSVIQEALAKSVVTRKKVYVATDIAEVSVTLPDVVFVIDSGTGKRPQVSPTEQTSYAFPPLRLLWETASNAQQRRGRVGRVQQGFYFSLLSKEHHKALRETENRIKNAVLTELVLHSLLITQKPFAFFQLCNERPENRALSYSLHLLQDGGLIIGKDDPLAEAERVALDRAHTNHVIDSPWNALIEEALSAAPFTAAATETPSTTNTATAMTAETVGKEELSDARGKQQDKKSVDDADDDDDVRIPEAEGDAFQRCYYMTLRGVIAARSPVSVAAATNVFYGLLCGTPTLNMLAAAIESSKSPFHVPYTINDRMERVGMVRAVSQIMQRYHGSLQSDLICAMEVVLEYMSMQRDGLSEEAQEEWCQERSVSRTRIVDTLNLFAQMKEQVNSVLPFPDVTDIDVLTAQFNQNAELLVLMLVASHTELAIQVQLDGPVAQKKGFVGHGMFFPLKCLKDETVPTVCPWDRTKISVPLSLQTIQRKVLAVFSSQVEPDLFALVVLVFSFKLRYTVLENDAVPSYLMSVSHSGVCRTFQCDVLTAQQILQLRRIQCAQLRCMQVQVEEGVKANESEKLSAVLRSVNTDFGLPESAMQAPYLIATVLQHGLKLLVSRLRGSPSFTVQKQPITSFPPGTPYCKLQHTAVLSPPILQSVLIHSSNGLSVVEHVASPVTAKAEEASDSATPAAAIAVEVQAEAGVDDEMSESGSEDHVATFRYD